jgi:diguanylate cyclase
MSKLSNPSEIAREALRQLALRRIAPTPDNYRKLYHEIAGSRPDDDALPEAFVRKLARRLPRDNAERQRHAHQLEQALADGRTKAAEAALERYIDGLKLAEQPVWNELIGNLLRQWESPPDRLDPCTQARIARPRAARPPTPPPFTAACRVCSRAGTRRPPTPTRRRSKCSKATSRPRRLPLHRPKLLQRVPSPTPSAQAVTSTAPPPTDSGITDALRELLGISLGEALPPLLEEHPELRESAATLCKDAAAHTEGRRAARSWHAPARVRPRARTRPPPMTRKSAPACLNCCACCCAISTKLVLDDRWLSGQIEMLREIVDSRPDPRQIDDAGRRLKELIQKQGQLKHTLAESQRHLRDMLAGFVDQLARFSESTGAYQDRIGKLRPAHRPGPRHHRDRPAAR